jgi:hypothetical protein
MISLERRATLPVDFHRNLAWANRRQLIGGFACQNSDSDSYGSVSASLGTASLNMKNFSEALNASTSRRVRSWNTRQRFGRYKTVAEIYLTYQLIEDFECVVCASYEAKTLSASGVASFDHTRG